jgi:hypothetical protein
MDAATARPRDRSTRLSILLDSLAHSPDFRRRGPNGLRAEPEPDVGAEHPDPGASPLSQPPWAPVFFASESGARVPWTEAHGHLPPRGHARRLPVPSWNIGTLRPVSQFEPLQPRRRHQSSISSACAHSQSVSFRQPRPRNDQISVRRQWATTFAAGVRQSFRLATTAADSGESSNVRQSHR